MRIMVSINGRLQVSEVLEFEPLDGNSVRLNTPKQLLDIRVTGIDREAADGIVEKLMIYGYADLRSYPAKYIEDEDTESSYECECQCGNTIELKEADLDRGYIFCPNCGEELEFEEIIDEGESSEGPLGEDSTEPAPVTGHPEDEEKTIFGKIFPRKRKSSVPWEG